MAYAVSAYSSGRAGSAAISPLRAASPDRKSPSSPNQESTAVARITTPRDEAANAQQRAQEPRRKSADTTTDRTSGAASRQRESESNEAKLQASREARREDIKKLEQIRAAALYPAPATAKERSVAQLAHTQIIRAEAELRAQELETIRQRTRDQDIARFHAAQAAAAYRELDQAA
jgi:hypothetical protein